MFDIKPFTEIWFKDCYNMALLPIVNYSLGNADCLLYNQLYFYKSDAKGYITVEGKEFKSVYDILTERGIDCMPFTKVYDILEFLKMAFKTNHVAIVGIDSYYESMRIDTFNKKHQGHSVLVFDLDEVNENAHILEQPFFSSCAYSPQAISYENLERCHNAYNENRNMDRFFYKYLTEASNIYGKQPSACLISTRVISEQQIDSNARRNYVKCLHENIEHMSKVLVCIESYLQQFQTTYFLFDSASLNNTKKIDGITEIILAKEVEQYLFKKLFPNELMICDKLKTICENWSLIRAILTKRLYGGKSQMGQIEVGKKLIKEIHQYEISVYDKLLSLIAGGTYD